MVNEGLHEIKVLNNMVSRFMVEWNREKKEKARELICRDIVYEESGHF